MKTFNKLDAGVQTTTTARRECQVFEFQLPAPVPREIKKGRRFSDFAKEFSLGENHADALSDARRWLGEQIETLDEAKTLSSLRLAKGMSQERLGELVGTQQPNVARFEKGIGNPGIDMIRRWCAALEIDMNTFDQAHQASARLNSRKEV
ncbi:helix-turn-helix domain-containing protein [Pseudomonas sp. HMSC75E02]|uniref:helix-turn-helix domain-containing protein n=1 Tax=Pseudomonas sp. HMSC75E02 TaxID=1608908 RepID=UPI0009F3D4AD|nr:helix-turn-helix transcriptional regulator [Pseudomonas sp. HMSC75E02]